MQSSNEINKITEGIIEFQRMTFFIANYIKVNLATRSRLSVHINENGEVKGLRVLVDNELPDGEGRIGLGEGPTYAIINF